MTAAAQLDIYTRVLPYWVWLLVALFSALLMALVVALRLRTMARAALRIKATGPSNGTAEDVKPDPRALFERTDNVQRMSCQAELVERRPLSEAQWDSPVPAAWTIFNLKLPPHNGSVADTLPRFQLGLLLPVQHREAYSSGFIERLEGDGAEDILKAFAGALSGPVPSKAIYGSTTGFLEFKTYVENEHPDVIPGNLDLSAADYWIFVKLFVQDSLEFYLRLNASKGQAEFVGSKATQGEEIMRVLAATLRPEG
jgi:hypothetical protein